MSPLNRILLLITGVLAAYQIAAGIEGLHILPTISYTIAFGILLVAALLMLIFGFETLDSPLVVIVSTVIPLGLSLGLVWDYLAAFRLLYLAFAVVGFLMVMVTRFLSPRKLAVFTLILVHGIAGLTIFLLPFSVVFQGKLSPGFSLVGIGGALMGVGGLLLSFLKAGRPVLARETILSIFPGLLLLTMAVFIAGFRFQQ
jgi:hypothetical protein